MSPKLTKKRIAHTCANCSKEGLKHIEAIIEGKTFWFCSLECLDRFEALLKGHKEELITEDDRLLVEESNGEPIMNWNDQD